MKKQTNNADQDKKYLQALKESDERFRSIVLWSPDAIIVTDVEGKIEYMNPTAEKVFNRKLESFVGKDFGLAIVNGESTEIDIVRPGKDTGVGEMYVVETEWLGEKAHLITIRDITDRKKAEEALRESENKYRLLADNVHDVIFVLDMNLKYTYISPSVKILRGYEPEELLNKTPIETLTPSSMDLAMKTLSEIIELEKSGRREINVSWTLQLEMIRKDGTTMWTEVKFSFIRDENQQPVGIVGVTRDITERKQAEAMLKQSEERYRSIFENSPEGIFRSTPEGKINISNQALANMLGYESSAELMTSITDATHQLYVNPEDRRKLQEMIEEHGFIKGYEVQYYKKDRSIIWGSMNMHVVRDENGKIIHWDGIAVDITNRKRAEDNLKESGV